MSTTPGLEIVKYTEWDDTDAVIRMVNKHHATARARAEREAAATQQNRKQRSDRRKQKILDIAASVALVVVSIVAIFSMFLMWG